MAVTVPSSPADAIIFAINSAIKLSNNIRKAYAQSIRGKELALPLPPFDPDIKLNTIRNFFNKYEEYAEQVERLGALHRLAVDSPRKLSENEEKLFKEYLKFYHAFFALHTGKEQSLAMKGDDLIHLFRIRQWEHGTEPANVLQLVAGSLVEIGIDYFLQTPGALNTESAQGRIMHNFLTAFDEIDFSESKDIKLEVSKKLVPRLFAVAAESFAELSPESADDPKLQLFIKETAKGIATDLYKRFEQLKKEGKLDRGQEQEATNWGQLVLRSMIGNAGAFVFKSPEALFDTNKPVSDIIQSTGLTLMNAILGFDPETGIQTDPESNKIQWRNAISADTLNGITLASLEIVAEHPNLISGNQGIQAIIGEVTNAVKDEDFQKKGLVPELARLVLEKSAGNLELLWRTPEGDQPGHLLVSTVKQLLGILSEKHGDAPWRPALTKAHLLGLAAELLDEVVRNPSWITDKANQDSIMAEVLDISFSSLSRIPKEERLNAETIRWLIRLNLQAALTSKKVLDTLKWGNDQNEVVILKQALELVFLYVFPKDAAPNVSRMELLTELTEYIVEVIIHQHPGRRGLVLADLILFDSGIDFSEGFNRGLADELMNATFDTLSNRPELLTRHEGLKHILGGVAGAVTSAKLKQPGLLPFLAQLVLEKTAQNAHLLLNAAPDQPQHLLTTALQQILTALSNKDDDGNWRPEVSPLKAQSLIGVLLGEVVAHPSWVTDKVNEDTILAEVLDIVFTTMDEVPSQDRLSSDTLQLLIQSSLQVLVSSPLALKKVTFAEDEEEKAILQRALGLVFTFVFPKENTGKPPRIQLLKDLLDYSLSVIMANHPDGKGLILINLILFDSGIDYAQGFDEALADQLADATLDALASQPELLAKPKALQQIIKGVADAIDSAQLKQPGLLPLLIRLALQNTALNANLLIGANAGQPRHLITTALEQILPALSAQNGNGQWRPEISPALALGLTESLLGEVVRNPNWVASQTNQDSLLSELLNVTFKALAKVPEGQRLSMETLEGLIQLNIRAAAGSPHVLRKITFAGDDDEKAILERALGLALSFVFPEENSGRESRPQLLKGLLDYSLGVIMAHHPNEKGLILLDLILFENNAIDFSNGFNEALADQLVDAALGALSQQPGLVSNDQVLKAIIGDVATALKDSGIKRPELLPELIRLTLEYTAEHLGLLLDLDEEKPKHLLVSASRQVLKAIAEKPETGKWKPRLSNSQITEILEITFDAVVKHPQWIQAEEVVYQILDAIFRSMEVVSSARKLPFIVLQRMIESAMEAASRQRKFIASILTDEQIMLRYALENLFQVVFVKNGEEETIWRLGQAEVISDLIDYFLLAILESPGDKTAVDHVLDHIQTVITAWKQDLAKTLDEILEQLENANA